MKRIGEKLKSQRGASILLALLFFLLCAMVGASVLMAAASNAGRSRISREEQQKYLTLSSALQLVCDELTAAEYKGTYTVKTISVNGTDDKGNPIVVYTYKQFSQGEGEFTCGLNDVMPLRNELNYLFAELFSKTGGGLFQGDDVYVQTSQKSEPSEHTLTLTVDGQADKPGLTTPVTVTVTLGSGKDQTVAYRIYLKAELGNDSTYTMYAELQNNTVPTLTAAEGDQECVVNWKLSQITREEAK